MHANSWSDGKIDAGNALLQRESDAFQFRLDIHSLKPRLIVDADTVSDESTRKSLSSGAIDLCVELGMCCCESGDELLERDAAGAHNVDGLTRERIRPIEVQRRGPERGGVNMEVSTKCLSATTRTFWALMPLYFGEGWSFREKRGRHQTQ